MPDNGYHRRDHPDHSNPDFYRDRLHAWRRPKGRGGRPQPGSTFIMTPGAAANKRVRAHNPPWWEWEWIFGEDLEDFGWVMAYIN